MERPDRREIRLLVGHVCTAVILPVASSTISTSIYARPARDNKSETPNAQKPDRQTNPAINQPTISSRGPNTPDAVNLPLRKLLGSISVVGAGVRMHRIADAAPGRTVSSGVAVLDGLVAILDAVLVVRVVVEAELFAVVRLVGLQEVRDGLLALEEDLDEVCGDVGVALVVERGRQAFVADTRSAACEWLDGFRGVKIVSGGGGLLTDAVDVLGDAAVGGARQLVVDDVHHVLDVEAAGGDAGCDEDGALSGAEGAAVWVLVGVGMWDVWAGDVQGVLALALGAVRVDGGAGETHVVEVVVDQISLDFGVDEDKCARRRHRQEQVVESLLLEVVLDEYDLGCVRLFLMGRGNGNVLSGRR